MNRKTLKYAFVAGLAIGIAAAFLFVRQTGEERKKEACPREVVETFYGSLTSGEFEEARALCDTSVLETYINAYEREWRHLQEADSIAHASAAEMLKGATLTVQEIKEEGNCCRLSYRIEALGEVKTKEATLRKDEGKWILESITDAI